VSRNPGGETGGPERKGGLVNAALGGFSMSKLGKKNRYLKGVKEREKRGGRKKKYCWGPPHQKENNFVGGKEGFIKFEKKGGGIKKGSSPPTILWGEKWGGKLQTVGKDIRGFQKTGDRREAEPSLKEETGKGGKAPC